MIGVVVGRFQTPQLTAGHGVLLTTALDAHRDVLVVIGCTGGQPTETDPLDYETRALMLKSYWPRIRTAKLLDHPSNEQWSRNLDALIEGDAQLFASRDSFAGVYSGKHPVVIVPEAPSTSGTDERTLAAACVPETSGERRAAIYAATRRFPTSYQAVDVIIRGHVGAVLLGRKPGNTLWQFPGGFVDPTDASLEHAAMREAREETNIHIERPRYLGSVRVDDYRYRKSIDKCMSAVFYVEAHSYGEKPGDDLEELKWVDPPDVERKLAPMHGVIWQLARTECE